MDRVLSAPEQMEGIAGREITVRLRGPAEPGTTAVFDRRGLAVRREHGRPRDRQAPRPPRTPSAAAAEDETRDGGRGRSRRRASGRRSRTRADEASAVVVGRVTGRSSRDTAAATGEGRLSEHDPQWAVATVEVDEAVKGRPPKTIEVLFATSEDVMWHRAPKLVVGQRAVMLLHKGAPEVEDKRANAVVDELDVQPPDAAALVASSVSRGGDGRVQRSAAMTFVVNMIPNVFSGESNQDSEPNLAIDPADPRRIAGSAFTPDPLGGANAPIFVRPTAG